MPESMVSGQDLFGGDLSSWDAAPLLHKVTDLVPNVIYIFNQQTQSNEYSNRSLGEAMGFSPEEVKEMGADLMPRLIHPSDLPRIGAHFGRIAALSDGQVAELEYRIKHRNGSWVWLQSKDTVFDRDATGSVLRHIGVASDITALKRAEEIAVAETQKANTTNAELRAFAYSVTHDLKAPSNTLSLLLQELLDSHDSHLDPDAKDLVDMAQQTVSRMGELIEDVLDYTRVVGQSFHPGDVALDGLIDTILATLSDMTSRAQARISVGQLPTVHGDPAQLLILFQHLIENAVKFHPVGVPPTVRIFMADTTNSGTVKIVVEDDGIGIHPAKHEQVFEIFKRLNTPLQYEGSGLGLAICRRIAINHDSDIALQSAPDKGASFAIELTRA